MRIFPLIPATLALFVATSAFGDVDKGIELLNAGDVSGAAKQFADSYEAGDGEGAFYLGRLFELGLGTDKDEMRAANLYSAGADAGSSNAKLRLGLMYHEGRVLLRDYIEGTRLICEAADAGNVDAEFNCGLAYKTGRGVDADMEIAVRYWEQAAKAGNVPAINFLAQYYQDAGEQQKAADLFKHSADLGNAAGMFGYASIIGAGETPDLVNAYAYASLAVVRGHPDAGAFRDELEARMTSQDVLAAQAAAKAWTEARIAKASTAADALVSR